MDADQHHKPEDHPNTSNHEEAPREAQERFTPGLLSLRSLQAYLSRLTRILGDTEFDLKASVLDRHARTRLAAKGMYGLVLREKVDRYLRDVVTLRLDPRDWSLKASHWNPNTKSREEPGDWQPTGAEADAIREEASKANWPKQKRFAVGEFPPGLKRKPVPDYEGPETNIFNFRTEKGEGVAIEERRDHDGSERSFHRWTLWSDGKWRAMEPEGLMPLYGIEDVPGSGHLTAIIHEGAKAAAKWRRLVRLAEKGDKEATAYLAAHPFGDALNGSPHLGWSGGAFAAHNTDWAALARVGISSIHIIADNDAPGQKVIQTISRLLKSHPIKIYALRFDSRFPEGFDLCDEMPRSLFEERNGSRIYIGPSYLDLLTPATWATRRFVPAPTGNRGRPPGPIFNLRPMFTQDWWVIPASDGARFVHEDRRTDRLEESGLNVLVAPFTDDGANVAKLLIKDDTRRVDGLAYKPGAESVVADGRKRLLNTWDAPLLQPRSEAARKKAATRPNASDWEPEWKPWTDYLAHLFPKDEDRHHVCRWLATLIARPEIRMTFGLFLTSTQQGTGKTTLGKAMSRVIGKEHVCFQEGEAVTQGKFNGYLAHRRLIVVNEIYAGNSWSAYHKIKTLITDDDISVEEKYQPSYQLENQTHWMLFSNRVNGLPLEESDRRFLVPDVTEECGSHDFWSDFHAWLDGDGPFLIEQWAEAFTQKHRPFLAGERPPMTEKKRETIEESRGRDHELLHQLGKMFIEHCESRNRDGILVDKDVAAWLKAMLGGKESALREKHIRDELKKAGLHIGKEKVRLGVNCGSPLSDEATIDGAHARPGLLCKFAASNPAHVHLKSVREVQPLRVNPNDLIPPTM